MIKKYSYSLYNMLPVFIRKVLYAFYFSLFHKYAVKISALCTKDRSGFKAYFKTLLKIHVIGFAVFAVAGFAFYLDGVHKSSALVSLTSNMRIEFIIFSLMLAACIHYSKYHLKLTIEDKAFKKGGKYVSYNKK